MLLTIVSSVFVCAPLATISMNSSKAALVTAGWLVLAASKLKDKGRRC